MILKQTLGNREDIKRTLEELGLDYTIEDLMKKISSISSDKVKEGVREILPNLDLEFLEKLINEAVEKYNVEQLDEQEKLALSYLTLFAAETYSSQNENYYRIPENWSNIDGIIREAKDCKIKASKVSAEAGYKGEDLVVVVKEQFGPYFLAYSKNCIGYIPHRNDKNDNLATLGVNSENLTIKINCENETEKNS